MKPPRPSRTLPFLAAAAAVALTLPGGASAGVALSTSGWEWSDPSPQGYTLSDVQFWGTRGYAVGSGGTALRTDDGGATWSGLFTGTSVNASSIDVISPDAIAVTTGNDGSCAIRLSTDGGATFKLIPVGDAEANCSGSGFSAVDFTTPTVGYVMRTGGAVIATTDGGDSFGSRSAVDGGTSLRFLTDQIGFATSSNGKIYKTTDGAQTWAPIADTGGPLDHLRITSLTDMIAWGKDRLVRSTDTGATWVAGAIAGDPSRASWADAKHLAFISDAKLLLSDDGGASIREVTLGNKDVIAAAYVDLTHIVAVGLGGVTYLSSDAGANFTRLSTDPVGSQIGSLRATGGGPVGIGDGRIARLVDGHWVLRSTLSSASIVDADFSSPDHGYVVREGNTLLRTANNGVSWSPVDPGTNQEIQLVVTPNDTTTLLFGRFGVLRATGGGAFDPVSGKAFKGWSLEGARSAGSRVVTWGGRKTAVVVLSRDAGKTWKALTLPKGVRDVGDVRLQPGTGLLLESKDRVFRAAKDGGKWTEVTGLGFVPATGLDGPGITPATAAEWFAAGDESWPFPVVMHTTDAGRTWHPQAVGADDTQIRGLVATAAHTAFALSGSSEQFRSAIFGTTGGGSRGTPTTLSLAKTPAKPKRSGGRIRIVGQLGGGKGGETVHVALRKVGSGAWTSQNVTVGANGGGSFTASLKAKAGRYVVVAQWAGDSGRAGTGTPAKSLTVK